MNKKVSLLISLLFFLQGCSSTGVIPMSQDSYFIGKKDGSPGIGISLSNKAEVYKEANEFCREKDLEVFVLRENVIPAAPARLGSTELTFKCVKPGGTSQGLVKEADTVIKVDSDIKTESSISKDMYSELLKLKELRDANIITQSEFESEKKEILSKY
ncbi:SHOCT domain-containing protein [Shewanella sp. 10N.7]|uniref:SHOCT domain-containing protein n=1 Tax=Shewanella sp. 10N.7 TaxID=2885093 RepID=UPI001E37BBE5|nr:SHOCT domain-containing protein [Shewanella sp. 10N.7]MCC4833798.1 SHOCT domain-containing protein [Shewanella sp. 10N.7]